MDFPVNDHKYNFNVRTSTKQNEKTKWQWVSVFTHRLNKRKSSVFAYPSPSILPLRKNPFATLSITKERKPNKREAREIESKKRRILHPKGIFYNIYTLLCRIFGMMVMGTRTVIMRRHRRLNNIRECFFFRLLNMNPWRRKWKYSILYIQKLITQAILVVVVVVARPLSTIVRKYNTVFHIDYVMHNVLEGIMGLQWLPIYIL